ncbi:hypothetical protein TNCV_4987241 [Trichonephila clavipes]|nr:hypothetical protein TNCV_4987241 [Trichonephila clavipes]
MVPKLELGFLRTIFTQIVMHIRKHPAVQHISVWVTFAARASPLPIRESGACLPTPLQARATKMTGKMQVYFPQCSCVQRETAPNEDISNHDLL